MFSYLITNSGRISVTTTDGNVFSVAEDHPNYRQIVEALRAKDEEAVVRLGDIPKAVAAYTGDRVKIVDGQVLYEGKVINNGLTRRILTLMNQNLPFDPLLKFFENVMLNPSKRAVDELYPWLEKNDCVITEDGCFLGYKRLNTLPGHTRGVGNTPVAGEPDDKSKVFVDVHSGTIRQWMGHTVTMERNQCDDNWGRDCSEGLHVGSSKYQFSGDVRVLVKVNPKDVVAVESGYEKLRTCAYTIVKIWEEDLNVDRTPLTDANGNAISAQPVTSPWQQARDEDEEEYDDDDDDDFDDDDDDDGWDDDDEDEEDEEDDEDEAPEGTNLHVAVTSDVSFDQLERLQDIVDFDTHSETRNSAGERVIHFNVDDGQDLSKLADTVSELRFVINVETDD